MSLFMIETISSLTVIGSVAVCDSFIEGSSEPIVEA